MPRLRLLPLLFLLPVLLPAVFPAAVTAQDGEPAARVDRATGRLDLDLAPFFRDEGLRRALHSGLPVRMEVRVELWRDGFFDQQDGGGSWRASVIHDPVSGSYDVTVADSIPRTFATLEDAGASLETAFDLDVRPRGPGRYYYLAEVELETLSLSDLEELARWLQGDLGPVVSGDRPAETAMTKGLRRLMVRALGLPARRDRLRTSTFSWPAEGGG